MFKRASLSADPATFLPGRTRPARSFGRRRGAPRVVVMPDQGTVADDLKLFANAFIGGLLFMAVYLG